MTLPTLSLLIPCYNAGPYLAECLDSILPQLADGIECIVVDDGSTDGSADVVTRRAGARLKLLRQPNGGVAAARNRAFAESSGELIAWFDADDVLAPGSLETRRRVFAERPALDMLMGQYEVFDMDTGGRETFPQPPVGEDYVVAGLLRRRNLPHMNALTFRRRAIETIGGFDSALRVCDDWDLWVRAFGQLRWHFVERCQAYQRQGSFDSLTRRGGRLETYREQGDMLKRNRARLRQLLGSDRPWRHAYAAFAADLSLMLLLAGRRRDAAAWAIRGFPGADGATRGRLLRYLAEAAWPAGHRLAGSLYRRVVRA